MGISSRRSRKRGGSLLLHRGGLFLRCQKQTPSPPESPMRCSRNYCVPPKVLCVAPEITAFPRKSYALLQKLLHSPESAMRCPEKSSTLGSSRPATGVNTLFAAEAQVSPPTCQLRRDPGRFAAGST